MKKGIWILITSGVMVQKVVFDREVSREEAIKYYENGDYDDILDEDYSSDRVIDAE